MWVSPMPLYPYCQNSPEPKWVPSFLLLLHIIKWFLEEDLIGCFLAKCSVGHLSMFSVLQASADRPSESMADICLAFFLLLLSVNNELQSHCGSCLGTLKSDNDRAGSTINQSDCESLCFVHFSGSGNLSYCQNCPLHGFKGCRPSVANLLLNSIPVLVKLFSLVKYKEKSRLGTFYRSLEDKLPAQHWLLALVWDQL